MKWAMNRRFYLDTSIWLDLFENRDEPNFAKGTLIKELLKIIVKNEDKIIYSDLTVLELEEAGYPRWYVEELIEPFSKLVEYKESNDFQIGKARDLAAKRDVPPGDALHSLLSRDSNAFLLTYDNHFKELLDITKPHTPQEFI